MQFLLFHWAASPANVAKGTVGKTAVLRLNQGLAVAPNIQSHWIHHWHTQWKKSQFYVGLSLMKQLKTTEILTHEYTSFILCDEMDAHVTGFSCLCNTWSAVICCFGWSTRRNSGFAQTHSWKSISHSLFTSAAHGRVMTVSRKNVTVAVESWTNCFSHGSSSLLERTTYRWTMVIQTWVLFLKMNTVSLSPQGKQGYICWQ